MLFLIYRKDKPGSLSIRIANYAAHLEYLGPYAASIVVGGPTLGAGSGTGDEDMTGSFLILEAEGWDEAERFIADDPFTKAGLFATVIVDRWKHGKHSDLKPD
ncbi:YciI-like protein [Caballeronia catudaia]|uniref:YciI-like protein n=1 Tax=Caballeronia catudaia TaxID=1777136 RepID=A0A158DTL3_9BURK|nr:YciI family protein [Caballeronia catudaia]SAK97971.1 YciI-like protein [Caballeronia catudaia]